MSPERVKYSTMIMAMNSVYDATERRRVCFQIPVKTRINSLSNNCSVTKRLRIGLS